jgi:transcriptional regulator with XRE-family HTH domain
MDVHALARLIRQRMAERHWSYADIARRGGLPRSTVHHLATVAGLARPPLPATLERLAVGLDLPLDAIRVAAASAAGIVVSHERMTDPDIDVIVAGLSKLTPDERRHVQALIESLLTGRK